MDPYSVKHWHNFCQITKNNLYMKSVKLGKFREKNGKILLV